MASHSPIDIVQSVMQDQGYLQEADFFNHPKSATAATAKYKSSQKYEPEEFINKPVASQVVSEKSGSSQCKFKQLLNEDFVADAKDIDVGLSNGVDTFLNKTTEEFGIVSKPISDKIVERAEESMNADTSERLSLALDDASDASVVVVKRTAEDNLDSAPELTKQDSVQITKEQSDTDAQVTKIDKETSDDIIQIASIVSQSSIAITQSESPEYESGKTNDKCRKDNTAESVTTESLEAMLESFDGPAEPQVTEYEGNSSTNSNTIVVNNTFITKSRQDLTKLRQDMLEETMTSEQHDLLMVSVEEDADVAASPVADAGTNTPGADALSCQNIEIKAEDESGDEVTYTDTFCEGPYDHDSDAHYFKMFECKVLTIDIHDIIKTESARDAKAGLYKPSERKSIDIIRKEYKTKAMQDYIRKVNRLKLPEENSIPRYTSKDKNPVAPIFVPMCLVYPMKKKKLSPSKKSYTKSSNKVQIPKTISCKRNAEGMVKKIIRDDYVGDIFDDDYQPSDKSSNSNKTQIPKKISHKRDVEARYKKLILDDYVYDIFDDENYHQSDKTFKKAQIPKRISQKKNVEARLKKQSRDDYVGDILDDGYHPSNKSSNKEQFPKIISHKRNVGVRLKKRIRGDGEDYQSSVISANYTCVDCMEGFETNAELKVHKRMEHKQSIRNTRWKTPVKSAPKKKRDTIPSYFKSNQYRIDGINGMKSVMNFKPKFSNLNKEDMIQGANMVYNQHTFYNHELGKNISDQEMYQHMVKKYTIKVAQLCIGANRFSSYYQLAKAPTDSLHTNVSIVTVDRGHVLITSPLLHW